MKYGYSMETSYMLNGKRKITNGTFAFYHFPLALTFDPFYLIHELSE